MQLTLASLTETVRQELGRTPARSTAEELVNEAGEAWVNLHEWRYLQAREGELSLVDGTSLYRLGKGVRAVNTSLRRPNSIDPPIPVLSQQDFFRFKRTWLSEISFQLRQIATTRWTQQEGDAQPYLYIELYPANLNETVYYTFDAGWLPLDNPSDQADIPGPLAHGFVTFIRSYAMAREKPQMGTVEQAAANFLAAPIGRSAMTIDGESDGEIIATPGGVGELYRGTRMRGKSYQDKLDHLRYGTDII